ncbi:nucleotidyltransferase domain-containing protein [Actinoplanes sp. G11-F43]|uniref:nucleotidyltransferase domain-containing protein n=1 Tax=Actinoplanes sp. G11-F43 TaxID=3424130 RepID=UPI003D338355
MSDDHQARLRVSGERLAGEFKTLPGVRSVLLTGSVARGTADRWSNTDLLVVWDAVPPPPDRHVATSSAGAVTINRPPRPEPGRDRPANAPLASGNRQETALRADEGPWESTPRADEGPRESTLRAGDGRQESVLSAGRNRAESVLSAGRNRAESASRAGDRLREGALPVGHGRPEGEPAAVRDRRESVLLDGVRINLDHRVAGEVDEWISDLVDRADPAAVKQHLVAAIRDGVVLHDTGLVPGWTVRTDVYPEALAVAVVRANLAFRSSGYRRRLLDRGDLLPLAEDRLDIARNVLLVLLGLNRVWLPHPGATWMSRLAEGLRWAPAGLPARLDALFTATPASAVPAADALISETLILVAQHLPDAGAETILADLSRDQP